ncbi:MAG: methyltransferase domain-containing protein [Kiritimatiellia bacterium]|jgi:SAM-dependent methyltransferase|nr:methyltransferase domain-containing protein [Kiritimatiellia bacterium]
MNEALPMEISAEVVSLRMKIFLRSPLRRRLLSRLMRLLDKTGGQRVLQMVADDAIGTSMRHAGGGGGAAWSTLTVSEAHAELLTEAGLDEIHLAELPAMPFEDGTFDAVVISEVLEYVDDPTAMMAELHRIMAPKTRLILHVRRRRRSVVNLFRRVAGLTDSTRPMVCPGFTPTELFDVIKDGFDFQESVGYGRFFSEFANLLAELFAGVIPWSCEPAALAEKRLRRTAVVYSVFTPVFWLANFLDTIFFFLPDHHMVLRARRRMLWVPRVTPRLRDGRNIAEATLGYRIGTTIT